MPQVGSPKQLFASLANLEKARIVAASSSRQKLAASKNLRKARRVSHQRQTWKQALEVAEKFRHRADKPVLDSLSAPAVAYFAGLIDGEGCIRIARHRQRRKRVTYYSATITVGMVSKDAVSYAHRAFGGTLRYKPSQRVGWNSTWVWYLCGPNAIRVATLLLPYLIVKRPQAALLVKFGQAEKAVRAHYFKQMTNFNRKGTMGAA